MGEDEAEALDALNALFENGFGERNSSQSSAAG